ncbi:type VII secretion protein EssB [Streptococcus oralis]|jgi:type VII secretion protein essB|uniref:Type VII secretion protein EssB n=1 Tax=Streptococcus oralis subsp. oralis TaxID=1891914 RepID=A0ABD6RK16_STROR|nr:type VII secretion protein EssB [Streptococcus oralis]MBA1350762.1 type VII secretion protein EssB [Streptococcus oralis subsp. oralis]ORO74241.1 type VII secretion protein EssB [Streptococcus oralis subsp. oralis]
MTDKIEIKHSEEKVKVILSPNQFSRQKIDTIENYVDATVTLEDNGYLTLLYQKPKLSYSLKDLIAEDLSEVKRLELAQKMESISFSEHNFKIPFIHPKNIFLQGSVVKILYFGLEGIMEPIPYTSETFLMTYKALIVSILRPKLDFELLVNGIAAISDSLVQDIVACESYDDVIKYIHEAYDKAYQEEKKKKIAVSKLTWRILSIGIGIFSVAAITLGVVAAYYHFWSNPIQKATINAQSHFINKQYDSVADDLQGVAVNRLSKEAKFVLASSYVRLDNLSEEQKSSVLNTITPSSEDNLLDYWIYLGKGDYKKSLDLAQNIGDDQLTLHAYTNLYEQTREDKNMNGAEKQKKLGEYRKEIEELSKKLGVKVGNKKDE